MLPLNGLWGKCQESNIGKSVLHNFEALCIVKALASNELHDFMLPRKASSVNFIGTCTENGHTSPR